MSEHFDCRALLVATKAQPAAPTSSVACGTCTVCCRKEMVMLTAHDDWSQYETLPVTNPLTGKPGRMIPHKPDGSCLYLGESGCTIYDRRPEICRAFSCVGWVNRIIAQTSRAVRRRDLKAGLIDRETWEAGIARGAKAGTA